jgi:cysteine sulfinate desulfinase/cysteine desulfurase-like protein
LGTTRFSFGYFNTPAQIEKAIAVLADIAKNPTVAIR